MGLLGTIIGGSVGFMMGGPLGAILGGAIGSNIGVDFQKQNRRKQGDSRQYGQHRYNRTGYDTRASSLQAQQTFMIAMISLAAKVAKADGKVTPEEVQSFDSFLKVNLQMGQEERNVAARIFNEARDSTIPVEEFARQIRETLGHQPARMRDLISLLMQIALADGHLHPTEEVMIRSIAVAMGLSTRDYDEAVAMFNPAINVDAAYTTLGISASASDAEVKKAYRQLAKEYHPDVLSGKGMSEDFIQFAAQKMRAVNNAYDQIKESRRL